MSLKEIARKEFGVKWQRTLSPRLVKLIVRIDSLPQPQRPVSAKQMEKALS